MDIVRIDENNYEIERGRYTVTKTQNGTLMLYIKAKGKFYKVSNLENAFKIAESLEMSRGKIIREVIKKSFDKLGKLPYTLK